MALTDRQTANPRKEDAVSKTYQTHTRYKQSNKHQPVRLAAVTLLTLVALSGSIIRADPNPPGIPAPPIRTIGRRSSINSIWRTRRT